MCLQETFSLFGKKVRQWVVNEIWFDMKDGRKALIRSPREEDIPGMLDYLLLSAGETEFILRYPGRMRKIYL